MRGGNDVDDVDPTESTGDVADGEEHDSPDDANELGDMGELAEEEHEDLEDQEDPEEASDAISIELTRSLSVAPVESTGPGRVVYFSAEGMYCDPTKAQGRVEEALSGLEGVEIRALCKPVSLAKAASQCFVHHSRSRQVHAWAHEVAQELKSGSTVILAGYSHGGSTVSLIVKTLFKSGVDLTRLHARTFASTYIPDPRKMPGVDLTHVMAIGDVATRCKHSKTLHTSLQFISNWRNVLEEFGSENLFADKNVKGLLWWLPDASEDSMESFRTAHAYRGPSYDVINWGKEIHADSMYHKFRARYAREMYRRLFPGRDAVVRPYKPPDLAPAVSMHGVS
jgi:hypothetical protein